MKVCFADFWPGFDPHNNFLIYLFSQIYSGISDRESVQNADLLIYSAFGNYHNNVNTNDIIKIFYTGENRRPNFDECNYSLTFDFDDYNGRNVRLPLWMYYIDWFQKGSYGNPRYLLPLNNINKSHFIDKAKLQFCSMVNSHLGNDRETIIPYLTKYKPLGLYGAPFNNPTFGAEYEKYEIISNYKFNICFENNNTPGYHTEKLFHAKTAGCIPLYNGAKTVEKDFNKDCFVNLQDFDNMNAFCDYVKEIDTNDDLYNQYKNQPLFNTPVSLDSVSEQILATIKI